MTTSLLKAEGRGPPSPPVFPERWALSLTPQHSFLGLCFEALSLTPQHSFLGLCFEQLKERRGIKGRSLLPGSVTLRCSFLAPWSLVVPAWSSPFFFFFFCGAQDPAGRAHCPLITHVGLFSLQPRTLITLVVHLATQVRSPSPPAPCCCPEKR